MTGQRVAWSRVKGIVPLSFKWWLSEWVYRERVELPRGRRAMVFLAADYGNIGDIAITRAQIRFLERALPHVSVVAVPISKTRTRLRDIKAQITDDDLITIIGGGNMGSLYSEIEAFRQRVIRSFPRNHIICFPQTLDFDDSHTSHVALGKIASSYACHNDIDVFMRERVSFERAEDLFKDSPSPRVWLIPDVVLCLDLVELDVQPTSVREGIVMCLRNDTEIRISNVDRDVVLSCAQATGLPIVSTDTYLPEWGLSDERSLEMLRGTLREFQSSRLVITDRLHGMIFAAISGTPCLTLPSLNHKTEHVYREWLSDASYVEFIREITRESVQAGIHRMLTMSEQRLALPSFEAAFEPLRNAVQH